MLVALAVSILVSGCAGKLKTGDAVDDPVNTLEGVSLVVERATATSAVYALINDGEFTVE